MPAFVSRQGLSYEGASKPNHRPTKGLGDNSVCAVVIYIRSLARLGVRLALGVRNLPESLQLTKKQGLRGIGALAASSAVQNH